MASIKYIFYFCGVKISKRHEVAAQMQRFLCAILISKYSRLECGSSNAHKVSARMILTAPSAVFCLMSK